MARNKNYYKDLANNYDFDPYEIISKSLDLALKQVKEHFSQKEIDTLVDTAVGTGGSFIRTKKFLKVKQYIGNDLSPEMLDIAKEKFPDFKAICGNAACLHERLSENSVDLAYMHFIFSYLDRRKFLEDMREVLKDGGYLSISSTTFCHLWELQEVLRKKFPRPLKFAENFDMPRSREDLEEDVKKAGYEVVASETVKIPVEFKNFDDLWQYGYRAGWHIQYFYKTWWEWSNKLWFRILVFIVQLLAKEMRFPMKAHTDIAVLLLRKGNGILKKIGKIENSILFNAGKHHLQTIFENIRHNVKQGESSSSFLSKLNATGDGVMDIYAGELTVDEIKTEVGNFLREKNLHDCEAYKNYLESHGEIKRRGHYLTLKLSDSSEMTLRAGDDEQFFVHIHPCRHSPNTFRLRAKTMKTAVFTAFLALCRNVSPYDDKLLGESRKNLGLPPLGESPTAVYETLQKLGFTPDATAKE